jgi:anthranilate 1,2-dioxygenase large subunit
MATVMKNENPRLFWPGNNYSLTPAEAYISQALFDEEQEKVFRGPTWQILGAEAEVPNSGDFQSSYIGTTPIVLHRAHDGSLNAYVNRCAHRGARVLRELRGNQNYPTCPYHNWRYDGTGKLLGVAMEKGLKGKGGYPDSFCKEDNGLQTLRVSVISGVVFGTLDPSAPELNTFLGPRISQRIKDICHKPLKILGYQRQTVHCNWKLFVENNRDSYHGPQLHSFIPQFGIARPADQVAVEVDGANALLSSWLETDEEGNIVDFPPQQGEFQLEDPSIVEGFEALGALQLSVISVFPASLFTCIRNAWSFRRMIPTSPGTTNIEYTWFGYEDDTEFEQECRLKQSNLLGPAGYVAMEDAEVLEMVQNAISQGDMSILQFGGDDTGDTDHFNSEASIRAFWKGYCEIMDIPLQGDRS